MAKKKLNIWQKIGVQEKPRRGRPPYPLKIVANIPSSRLTEKSSKKKNVKLTQRQKKIGFYNLEGACLGFVVGTALGGVGGMFVGVPVGTLAGNLIGKKVAGKKKGRPLKYRQKSFLEKIISTRQSRVEYNRKMLKLQKVKKR